MMLFRLPVSEDYGFERDCPRGMTATLLVAMVLSSAIVIGLVVAAWRFLHG